MPTELAPEARYTWYADFLSKAGVTPRPFDEWLAFGPERYAAGQLTTLESVVAALHADQINPARAKQLARAMGHAQVTRQPTGPFADAVREHAKRHPAPPPTDEQRKSIAERNQQAELEEQRDAMISKQLGAAEAELERRGAKMYHQSPSGSTYHKLPDGRKVRLSDHALPSSDERDNRFLNPDQEPWDHELVFNRGRGTEQDAVDRVAGLFEAEQPDPEPARYAAPRGWVAVDLDGTLARYDDWQSWDHIGEPVPEMVGRVKQWLAEGRDVRIFTARVYGPDAEKHRRAIEQWCRQYIGRTLPITATKDPGMYEFWDDRAIQVLRNTGRPVGRYSMTAAEVDEAVRDWQPPSEAQIEAGNYAKPTIPWKGLTIKIETPRGQRRKPEFPELPCHYGYIARLGNQAAPEARDDDKVDCFVGPELSSDLVVVIDQETKTGRFDEWKAVIGITSKQEALDLYRRAYSPGWRVGPATTMTVEQFKRWLKDMPSRGRIAPQVSRYTADPYDELAEQILLDRYARKHKPQAGQRTLHFESAAPTGARKWTAEDEAQHPRAKTGEFIPKDAPTTERKPAGKPKADETMAQHVTNLHDAMQERLASGKQFLARHDGRSLWISAADHLRVSPDGQTIEHTDPAGRWVRADLVQLDHWADKANLQPFTGPDGILTKQESDDARPTAPGGSDRESDGETAAPTDQPGDDRAVEDTGRAGPREGAGVDQAREPERLTGGKADQRPDSDFDPEALAKGVKVEAEHTDDPEQAREIAKDHLSERADYYDQLAKIEDQPINQPHEPPEPEVPEADDSEPPEEIKAEWRKRLQGLPTFTAKQLDDDEIKRVPELKRKRKAAIDRYMAQCEPERYSTDSPEFSDWFGDSQVRHPETGKPLTMYHGADENFDAFKPNSWFAFKPEDAKVGGVHVPKMILPVHIKAENPYRLDDAEMDDFKTVSGLSTERANALGMRYLDKALDEGHDAVEFPNYAYLIPSPDQIKSATANRGTYSREDPRINYEMSGDPDRYAAAQATDELVQYRAYLAVQRERIAPAIQGDLREFAKTLYSAYCDQLDRYAADTPDDLGHASATEHGIEFTTGKPVRFPYIHNTERAPRMGARFGQDLEPHGRYLQYHSHPDPKGLPPNMQSGEIEFQNPLVLAHAPDDIYGPNGWKARLSRAFGNLKGKRLSRAIAQAGHDGIVTVDPKHKVSSEIVDLTMWHQRPAERYAQQANARDQVLAAQQERAARRQEADRLREQATQLSREVVNKRNNQWTDQENQQYDAMMQRADALERQTKAELPSLARTPWHMTPGEFIDYHKTGSISPDAYRHGVGIEDHDIKDHPELVHTFQDRTGRTVELRQTGRPVQYVDHDEHGDILRDEKGLARYMPPEAVKAQGLPTHDTTVTAFADGKPLGYASNEWGADGVFVHPEEHGRGIGTTLLHHFRRQFPIERKIGQMTPAGEAMARAYHRGLAPPTEPTPEQPPTP